MPERTSKRRNARSPTGHYSRSTRPSLPGMRSSTLFLSPPPSKARSTTSTPRPTGILPEAGPTMAPSSTWARSPSASPIAPTVSRFGTPTSSPATGETSSEGRRSPLRTVFIHRHGSADLCAVSSSARSGGIGQAGSWIRRRGRRSGTSTTTVSGAPMSLSAN